PLHPEELHVTAVDVNRLRLRSSQQETRLGHAVFPRDRRSIAGDVDDLRDLAPGEIGGLSGLLRARRGGLSGLRARRRRLTGLRACCGRHAKPDEDDECWNQPGTPHEWPTLPRAS